MTGPSSAADVAATVRSFFARHEVAGLRLPSGWFGRPYDNRHHLTESSTVGGSVVVRLDRTQVLTLTVRAAAVDGRVLRIAIEEGTWCWTPYGGTGEHEERLSSGDVEFHAPGS